jgi:molybdopterin converting factor small subunit
MEKSLSVPTATSFRNVPARLLEVNRKVINDYRSLHTAVVGPGRLPLEVQIRTREMHAHAELGVAAHWQYKEGRKAETSFQQKINWLRQLLEPATRAGGERDLLDGLQAEIFEDRVYALSPKGEVVDLPRGATPLDFAYHVHTSLGHRCRGAKVNGRMVSLSHALTNGDTVEIIPGKQPNPSRDWLVPTLDGEHPHLTKPPMTYWALASSFGLLGTNEWAARLPGALAFVGTGLLVFGLGRRLLPAKPWLPALVRAIAVPRRIRRRVLG